MSKKVKCIQLLAWVFLLCNSNSFAQSKPIIECTSVANNGDVSITWTPPAIPDTCASFPGYEIYGSSTLGGGYSLLSTITSFKITSYLNSGAQGDTKRRYYYLKTKANCTGKEYVSDTIATIYVSAGKSSSDPHFAELVWNDQDPYAPSAKSYTILREFPSGSGKWSVLKSTNLTKETDKIVFCSAPNYKIEYSSGGCISSSKLLPGFKDVIGPVRTEISTVTVDTNTGKSKIFWTPNTDEDTDRYTILTFNGAGYDSLSQVQGRNTVTYLDSISDPSKKSESYLILPVDSCDCSFQTGKFEHKTILLKSSYDICGGTASLSWNKYVNWSGGIANYEIWANGSLIATVDSNTTSYVHTSMNQLTKYKYFIKAVPNIISLPPSLSNFSTITSGTKAVPKVLLVKSVNVTEANQVVVTGETDSTAKLSGYKLLRSEGESGPYSPVSFLPLTIASSKITLNDNTAATSSKSYYYKIEAIDSCGGSALISTNNGRTILNQVTPEEELVNERWNFVNELRWNAHSNMDSIYAVYRIVDGVTELDTIVSGGILNVSDDVTNVDSNDGQFCYKIVSISKKNNGVIEESSSNTFCIFQAPRLYVPNAFAPGGDYNPIFYAVNQYADSKKFQMFIYNRWGGKVFETEDHAVGWDGTYNGVEMEQGVYVYYVKLTGNNGRVLERKGTVTLLR